MKTIRALVIAAAGLATAIPVLAASGDGDPADPIVAARMVRERAEQGRDLEALERAIPDGASGDAWTDARAWILHRQGRHAEAAALLEPLVRPRHHTLPRWAIVHDHLGDIYAAMGRPAAAEGQWRVALATGTSPEGSGWDPKAAIARLGAATAEGGAPIVPVMLYPDAVYLLDLAAIQRSDAGVRYEKVELLLADEQGRAYSRFGREISCDGEPRIRVVWRLSYDSLGREIETPPVPDEWHPIRHDDPWLHTERRLVCEFPEGTAFGVDDQNDLERLRAYRQSGAPSP
jgi:hypothetical protein